MSEINMITANRDERCFRCVDCGHVASVDLFDCLGMDDGLLLCPKCSFHCPLVTSRDSFIPDDEEAEEQVGPKQLELFPEDGR